MKSLRNERSLEIREIAYAGLATALSAIFVSLSYILPFSSILMMLFVPILAALVAFNTRPKLQLTYILAIICLSFIDIQEGFFYLLPNTLIGLLFGDLIKKRVSAFYLFFAVSVFSGLLNSLSYYPIKALFEIDMIDVYRLVLNLDRELFIVIYPSFCFLISIVETFFLVIISTEELKKFKITIAESIEPLAADEASLICLLASLSLTILRGFDLFTATLCTISFIPAVLSGIILYSRQKTRVLKALYFLPVLSIFLFFLPMAISTTLLPLGLVLAVTIYPLCDMIFSSLIVLRQPSELLLEMSKKF